MPRGHMHTRCDACVWRAQAPRAHTRVGVRLSEICRTRTLGRSKAAKYGREVLRGGYNTRKMYLRGSFRVQASHGAQVLRVCAPCLAAYEHAALPHTGLSGSLHRQDLPPRAYQGAEVFFVRLLNARMSRAVGHVGDPPGLSFTWKFSTTTIPRLTWGIVDQFASAQSPRIH